MIISASYRTDIPAFYGDWFGTRLAAGWVEVKNPYSRQVSRVSLAPEDVDGFVFWTKNARPFLRHLDEVVARGHPFVVHYTVTGYLPALERSVGGADPHLDTIKMLANRFGRAAVVWRYDPVILTSFTPMEWHGEAVETIARALSGSVDEMAISFAHIYRKSRRNMDKAAQSAGFTWHDPDDGAKRDALRHLAEAASKFGIRTTLCAQPDLLAGLECSIISPARCVDAARLSRVAGRPIAARTKGNRPGCFCAESRDIGAYDTCPHGCVYCYAVSDPSRARARFKGHDPDGSCLGSDGPGPDPETVS